MLLAADDQHTVCNGRGVRSRQHEGDIAVFKCVSRAQKGTFISLLCFSNAWMMSRSSCRGMSALSRARSSGLTYIADCCILINASLQVLEDGRIDHARLRGHFEVDCVSVWVLL